MLSILLRVVYSDFLVHVHESPRKMTIWVSKNKDAHLMWHPYYIYLGVSFVYPFNQVWRATL